MSWSYTAGSAVKYVGAITFPSGIRFGWDDGSFQALEIPPITDSAPLRVPQAPSPRGGGWVGDTFLDVWQFDVKGWFKAADASGDGAELQAALDFLHDKINTYLDWQTVTLDAPGWSASRTMKVKLADQIVVDPRDKGDMTVPERVFVVPLIAADPRTYGAAVTTAITTGTSVTNAGNTPAPFDVIFTGPLTAPQVNGPGTGNIIKLTSVAGGQIITLTTVDPETGTVVLSDNLSTDPAVLFGLLEQDTADFINPGTSSWSKTATGAGSVSIRVKPAYA